MQRKTWFVLTLCGVGVSGALAQTVRESTEDKIFDLNSILGPSFQVLYQGYDAQIHCHREVRGTAKDDGASDEEYRLRAREGDYYLLDSSGKQEPRGVVGRERVGKRKLEDGRSFEMHEAAKKEDLSNLTDFSPLRAIYDPQYDRGACKAESAIPTVRIPEQWIGGVSDRSFVQVALYPYKWEKVGTERVFDEVCDHYQVWWGQWDYPLYPKESPGPFEERIKKAQFAKDCIEREVWVGQVTGLPRRSQVYRGIPSQPSVTITREISVVLTVAGPQGSQRKVFFPGDATRIVKRASGVVEFTSWITYEGSVTLKRWDDREMSLLQGSKDLRFYPATGQWRYWNDHNQRWKVWDDDRKVWKFED